MEKCKRIYTEEMTQINDQTDMREKDVESQDFSQVFFFVCLLYIFFNFSLFLNFTILY